LEIFRIRRNESIHLGIRLELKQGKQHSRINLVRIGITLEIQTEKDYEEAYIIGGTTNI